MSGKFPETVRKLSGKMSKNVFDNNKSMIKSDKLPEKCPKNMSRKKFGKRRETFRKMSGKMFGKCPENIRKMSGKCPENVTKNGQNNRKMSRKFSGKCSENVRKTFRNGRN